MKISKKRVKKYRISSQFVPFIVVDECMREFLEFSERNILYYILYPIIAEILKI